jgi:hypothetical protein
MKENDRNEKEKKEYKREACGEMPWRTNVSSKTRIKWSPVCIHTKETKRKILHKRRRKKKNAREQHTVKKMKLMLD